MQVFVKIAVHGVQYVKMTNYAQFVIEDTTLIVNESAKNVILDVLTVVMLILAYSPLVGTS